MLESIAGWLTPTSLFLLLNIVIGTIWVTSIFSTHHKNHHHHEPGTYYSPPPVAGAPSLLGRVGSINFGFHKYDPDHSDGYFPPAEQVYASITAQKTASSRLARAPSILDRVRSVNFNDFQFSFFHDPDPQQPHGHVSEPTQEIQERHQLARAPPSLLERVRSINLADLNLPHFSGFRSEPPEIADRYGGEDRRARRRRSENENAPATDPNPDLRKPPPLARAPSLLERVKSISLTDLNNFSGFRSEPSITEPKISDRYGGEDHRVRRRRSEKESAPATDPNKPPPLALLERVRSITFADLNNFSVFRSEPPEVEVADPDPDRRRARRGGSERLAAEDRRKGPRAAAEKMRKSASEKRRLRERSAAEEEEEVERRRPETARVERTVSIGGDVEVDAKADDFINRFKQQLKLQRLDSILQYKEMINRGASK